MSQYYNLEKAAEILNLSTGDVNRLREQGKIHGFRDGMNWKFKREDVENFLTDRIKDGSQKQTLNDTSDDDLFTLDNEAPSFDLGSGEDDLFTISDDELESVGSASKSKVNLAKSSDNDILDDDSNSAKSGVDLAGASGLSLSNASSSDVKLSGDSGLSLDLEDDDDIRLDTTGGSGLSLLDEVGDSSEEAGPNDFVLGGPSPSSDSKLNLTGNSSLSLDEDEDFKLVEDDSSAPKMDLSKKTKPESAIIPDEDKGQLNLQKKSEPESLASDEEDTFQLEEDDNNLYAIKGEEPATPVAGSTDDDDFASLLEDPQAPKEEESFQLSPSTTATDESDSESASQLIPVEDDTLFLSEDNPEDSATYDTATPDGSVPPGFEPAGPDLAFDNPTSDSFGGALDDSQPDLSQPAESPFNVDPSGGLEMDTTAAPNLPIPAVPTVECAYKAGRPCACEPTYSGMNILLILVPCLLILIPSAIAVFELIRSIWSWGEPYQFSGKLLETLASLLKL